MLYVGGVSSCLFEVDELNVEDEGRVLGDGTGNAAGSVSEVGRDFHGDALALRHLGDSLVPSLDHFSLAELELEGASTVARRVDLQTILEGEDVVALHLVARLGEVGAVSVLDGRDVDGHIS
ncbi:hypothetical protein PENTCL1PPCAC_22128, partial [Pristionchus entomophagus]